MMMDKTTLKNRLSLVMKEVKVVKKDFAELRALQREFKFSNLIPKNTYKQQINTSQQLGDQNKENNPTQMNDNQLRKVSTKELKTVCTKSLTRKNKILYETTDYENLETLKKKNDEIKDIKATLLMQLSEIKSMERKQQALRRTNQRIKAFNSEQKRNYLENQSKQKNNSTIVNSGFSEKNCSTVCHDKSQYSLVSSQISVAIPILLQTKTSTLKCPKGHQYYEGSVNKRNQPHGNGRLQICCSSISSDIGGKNLKDVEFFQGQFKDGKFHGFGTLSYKGGVKYVGQFKQGKRQGKGSLFYNGKVQVAKWENDIFVSIM